MKSTFDRSLAAVLTYEGGYTNDRRDPGNWTGGKVGAGTLKGTKKGIAAASYPSLDIKNLSDARIAEIYRRDFWDKVKGDALPAGVDHSAMDYGVNSGPSRSIKDLQRVLGVSVDGLIGPATLKAAIIADAAKTIKAHCARRMSFLRSLAIWKTFGNGWSNRVAKVEALALSLVLTKSQLEAEAKAARDKAVAQGGGAVATGGGGVIEQTNGGLSGLPVWLILAAVGAVVVALVIRAVINSQRAKALGDAAKGK